MGGSLLWLRRIATFVWLLILAAACLVWNTWAFLRTPQGAARLARQVETRVSALIAGDVRLGGLGTVGLVGARIEQAMILDPYGHPVIAARTVHVTLDPWRLVWGDAAVRIRVEGGRVEVAYVEAEDDVGIGLAFAPPPGARPGRRRAPGFREPLPPKPPLPIHLQSLVVEDTAFRLADEPGGPPQVLVRDIGIHAAGTWGERGAYVELVLAADVFEPLRAPLALDVEAAFAQDWLDALKVHAKLGDTFVSARGRGEMRVLSGRVVTEISVGPGAAQALGIPLRTDVAVGADFWLSMERSSVALRAAPGAGGAVALDGWFDRPTGRTHAQLVLAEIDPSRWIVEAPEGLLSGTARLEGLTSPEANLDLSLSVRRGSLLGQAVGPLELRGRQRGETLSLQRGELELPGVSIGATGSWAPGGIDLDAALEVADLRQTSRFAARLSGLELPHLTGEGSVDVHLRREGERTAVSGELSWPALSVGTARLTGASGSFSVDLPEGGLPSGSVLAQVETLEAGRLQGTGLSVEVERSREGDFGVDARASTRVLNRGAFSPTQLSASGQAQEDRIDLDRFTFRFGEGELRTKGPSSLRLQPGALILEGFRLEQSPGRGVLVVDGGLSKKKISLELDGRDLQLSVLPQAFLPEDLSGTIDLFANVKGTPSRPEGTVRFETKDLILGTVRDAAARGRVELSAGRAKGDIAAALGGVGGLELLYDGPVDPLGAPPDSHVDAELRLGPILIAGLGRAFEIELPQGEVSLGLSVKGAIGEPAVRLEAEITDLHLRDEPDLPGTWTRVTGRLREGYALVEVESWAGTARILELQAAAPFDARRLRKRGRREISRMLASRQSYAKGQVRGLDLALIGGWLNEPQLEGALRADFDIQGPILDPRGVVDVDVEGGPFGLLRWVGITSRMEFLPSRSLFVARVLLENQAPAEIRADVAASLGAFLEGTAAGDTPFSLAVDVPGIDLDKIGARQVTPLTGSLVRGSSGRGRPLGGTLSAQGGFTGNLARITGSLQVRAMDLVLRGVRLGGFDLTVAQEPDLAVALQAIDPGAGTLVGSARFQGAVSPLSLIRSGADALSTLPMDVRLEGIDLSLAPLSVASSFARASGSAAIDITARGTLRSPRPRGEIHVTGGQVELVGGPRYVDIGLDGRFSETEVVLSRFEASAAGGGRLSSTGKLEGGQGGLVFSLDVDSDRFPVGGPGGVSARVTGEGHLRGTVSRRRGIQGEFQVSSARILLPTHPPRELQTVSRNKDVTIATGPEAYLRERRARRRQRNRSLPVRIHVSAPSRFFVVGDDVNAELRADLTLDRLPSGDFNASGEVQSRRGWVRVLGRTFILEEGLVRWTGTLVTNPNLSITARYDARQATAWVDVQGPASNPSISFRSEPPLPESQIALLIATGRTNLPGIAPVTGETAESTQSNLTGAAASVAGSFAAARLRQALGPSLPLDVFALETSGENARLEAGTFVSERLYLGYLRNFLPDPGENLNEVRAAYELSRTVSLEAFAGDRAAAGVDLVWGKQIATPGQQRARKRALEERRQQREEREGGGGAGEAGGAGGGPDRGGGEDR